MSDTAPQTADGKVLWYFTMSLDGFVAGPNHEMDWMTGISFRPGLVADYVQTTGAVLGAETVGTTARTPAPCMVAPGAGPSSCSPTTPRTRRPPTGSRS